MLSIIGSEGSEVITKSRWRTIPCLRPNEAFGGLSLSQSQCTRIPPLESGSRKGEAQGVVFVLPTGEWPLDPHHSRLSLTWVTWYESPCPLPHQSLRRLLGNVTFLSLLQELSPLRPRVGPGRGAGPTHFRHLTLPGPAEHQEGKSPSSNKRGGPGYDLAHRGWHAGSEIPPRQNLPCPILLPSSPPHLTAELAPAQAGRADLWLGLPPI